MEKKPKTLVLIDGNAVIHRSYHALPPLTTKKGELVNAVYGFTMTLLGVLEKFKPDYIVASFDLAGPTFRHEKFENYKATRVKAPDDLYAQIPRVKEVVRALNIPIFEKEGYEADDCVGTLSRQGAEKGVNVIIVTGDMDTLQLVNHRVKVFTMRKGLKDTVLYDADAVKEKYGLTPAQIADYKGLRGDTSDNIPGVKGIGEKTASTLLQEYQNLEGIYKNIEKIKPAVREKLEKEKETAFLSRELGEIDTHVPLDLDLQAAETHAFDRDQVVKLFQELEFFSLLKRLPGEGTLTPEKKPKPGKKKKETKLEKKGDIAKALETGTVAAVWLKEEEGSLFGNHIEYVQVAFSADESFVIQWNDETKPLLKKFFENEKIGKIAYDGKRLMKRLHQEHIDLRALRFDILLAAYILNSGSNIELEYLCLAELGEEMVDNPATVLFRLEEQYRKKLEEVSATQKAGQTLKDVFEKIEMPLIPVLAKMEERGIYLNTEKFKKLSTELGEELMGLEKDIFKFAGKEFNINSPRQLADVLFKDLNIPTQNIKKTKTGISTASTELQKLQEYPIVLKVESYRELFKLKSTYLDVLPTLVDKDSRLHTDFQQAVAATGRLSSTDPNLQNIPARSSWSERIRGAFEPGKGNVFIGADYSQIELRAMAHMSGDKALTEAFQKGEDVHRATASVVFKVKPDAVTDDMRRKAKVFNFGIMYGMGTFGLAQAAQIDQKEAAEFIKAYFEKFSGVKKFIEEMKTSAKKNGYVETELGRRRYVPEIQSSNIQVVRAAERMAVNMPIQGLATGDIMKLAMLKIAKEIEGEKDIEMLLQVHDELIFEVKKEKAPAWAKKIKAAMESVYPLRVPVVAEVAIGKNWGEI